MSEKIVVPEKSNAEVKFTFKDEDGTALSVGAIVSFTYTLYDEDAGTTINSRSGTTATVTANPFYLLLTPADNAIVDSTKKEERHILEYVVVYNSSRGNNRTYRDAVDVHVKNLTKTT